MTCQKCGSQTPRRRLCRDCARDERHGQALEDEQSEEQDQDVLAYECTSCGSEYETADPGACPECGAHRRRFIGELEGAA